MNIAHNLEEKPRSKDIILDENVSFDSLLLSDQILRGLDKNGFKKPSPVQLKTVPLGRCGFDLIVKSKSGTGKTLVFAIIALEMVNATKGELQCLILAPTREIAVQIVDVLRNVGYFIDGLKVESFIGGLPLEEDIRKLGNCHIAVGAPGRVKHLLTQGHLQTSSINLFVLDEADKLMETSFQSDINEIYNNLPNRKQILALSATYPEELDLFLSNYMLSPTKVTSELETPLLLGLKQFVCILASQLNAIQEMKAKNDVLVEILSKIRFTQCLVFSKYQTRAESLCNFLKQKGWTATFISAALSQTKRLEAVKDLKEFKCRILLSTDLTARGIDAANVDLVINYDLPENAITYLHRMGRAGRYGSSGICITVSLNSELEAFQYIIGAIGGTNLSISTLPQLGENCDLWSIDQSSLEQIYGKIKPKNQIDKAEVLSFKESVSNKKTRKKTKKEKSESLMDILEQTKTTKFESSSDSKCIFESILNNANRKLNEAEDETKKRKSSDKITCDSDKETDTKSMFESILNETREKSVEKNEKLSPEDDSKKRKMTCDLNKENPKRDQSTVFAKNKALLSISKILLNSEISEEINEPISDYLKLLKDNEKNLSTEDKSFKDISINLESCREASSVEEIFKISYENAVGLTEKNWQNCFSNEELAKFEQFCIDESQESEEDCEVNEDCEEECEVNEDYEMETCEKVQETFTDLRWVPVEKAEGNTEKDYLAYFEECSKELWQNGLTFVNVQDFDDWFVKWQRQVESVRDYVRQNIYVKELNKYQGNKCLL